NLRGKTRNGHRTKRPEHKRSHKTPRDKIRHRECPAIRSSHRNPRTRPEGSRLTSRPSFTARSPLQKVRLLGNTEGHGITSPRSRDHYQSPRPQTSKQRRRRRHQLASLRKREIGQMLPEEREKKVSELRAELTTIRTQVKSGGTVDNPARVRELRRAIARLLTAQNLK